MTGFSPDTKPEFAPEAWPSPAPWPVLTTSLLRQECPQQRWARPPPAPASLPPPMFSSFGGAQLTRELRALCTRDQRRASGMRTQWRPPFACSRVTPGGSGNTCRDLHGPAQTAWGGGWEAAFPVNFPDNAAGPGARCGEPLVSPSEN